MISGAARVAGVIGWPIDHSRSPRLHGHWLARYGIDGAYVPLAVPPHALAPALRGLRASGFRGLNVTLPHKQAVMPLCDHLDASARAAGAVNTLVFENGATIGSNTDGAGFLASLPAPPAGPALLLGAGGAARAIAAALLATGTPVTLCNRTRSHAASLAAALPGLNILPWPERHAALARHALLVNATQLGMHGQPPLDLRLDAAPANLVVADIVYAPLVTPLLAQAQARGLPTVGGIGMLLHQAAPGFARWFGVTPAIDQSLLDAVLA